MERTPQNIGILPGQIPIYGINPVSPVVTTVPSLLFLLNWRCPEIPNRLMIEPWGWIDETGEVGNHGNSLP